MSFVHYAKNQQQTEVAELMDQRMTAGEISRKLEKDDSWTRRTVRRIKAEAHYNG